MSEQTEERGTCAACRHANQETMDAADGFWACPWIGATAASSYCLIKYQETGRYVFEPYDGANCTWGTGDPLFRSAPAGYEDRKIVMA